MEGLPTRDPTLPRRLTLTAIALLSLWAMMLAAQIDIGALVDARNLLIVGRFLRTFIPPETRAEFLLSLAAGTFETLSVATLGCLLAIAIGAPLSLLACSSSTLEPVASGRSRAFGKVVRACVRTLLTGLRGVPELVWAMLFVRLFGLGSAAAILALGIAYGGMLGKVYAELLENADRRPSQALLLTGSGRLAALAYGTGPLVLPELISYSVYRWECAVRAAAIMGLVGAGGLGQLLDQAMKMLNGGEAASITLVYIGLVWLADKVSSAARLALTQHDPESTAGLSAAEGRWVGYAAATICGALALQQSSVTSLVAGWHTARATDFFERFLPLETSPDWLAKVAEGAWETLGLSVCGTLIAGVAGLALALPAADCRNRAARSIGRWVLNALRGIPELAWATLTVLAVGLGPFAGTLALALHTAGVLGRLYAETLENLPPQPTRALALLGASPLLCFLYGTWPRAAAQLAAYTLYRWEVNIRAAAVMGLVGAGGLGQYLYLELSLFRFHRAGTVIVVMVILSIAVDTISRWLRRQLASP